MKTSSFIAFVSFIGIGFVAVYYGAGVYFCAGAGNGLLGGCAAMIGGDVLKSAIAQSLTAASMFGLALSVLARARRIR